MKKKDDSNIFELLKPKRLTKKPSQGRPYSPYTWWEKCRNMEWDKYQTEVLNTFAYSQENLLINAVAGAGKTFTIQAAGLLIKPKTKARQIAFNRAIKLTLENSGRLPTSTDYSTFHGLGMGLITKDLIDNHGIKFANKNDNKTSILVREWENVANKEFNDRVRYGSISEQKKASQAMRYLDETYQIGKLGAKRKGSTIVRIMVKKALSWTKNTLMSECHFKGWFTCKLEDYLTDKKDAVKLVGLCVDCLKFCLVENVKKYEAHGLIDFDDMIYLPVVKNWYPPYREYYFIDEAQDLNNAQLNLIEKMVAMKVRVIAVGDPRQAIYGFRGANTHSWDRLKAILSPTILDMKYTYRCGKKITQLASLINPKIIAPDFAEDGEIVTGGIDGMAKFLTPGDLVLSRKNAGLVAVVLSLVVTGKPVRLVGRDFIFSIDKYFGDNQSIEVTKWWADEESNFLKEIASLKEVLEDKEDDQLKAKLDELQDDYLTLSLLYKYLAQKCYFVSEFREAIINLTSDELDKSVLVSTIHRAKGLEADRVFILGYDKLPFKHPDADPIQELNLLYVALTRAKNFLCLLQEYDDGDFVDKLIEERKFSPSEMTEKEMKKWLNVS